MGQSGAQRSRRIQRGVQWRITCQGQEKESRRDEQQEAHQLIEPAVLGRRERTQKILHFGSVLWLKSSAFTRQTRGNSSRQPKVQSTPEPAHYNGIPARNSTEFRSPLGLWGNETCSCFFDFGL